MKKKDVVERILSYHPELPDYQGCDDYKSGFEDEECTGIAVALVPTVDVVRRASACGCNLLITHENRSIIRRLIIRDEGLCRNNQKSGR